MTFVLVGPKGLGKSCAGNKILHCNDVFQIGHDDEHYIAVATRLIDDRRITVVDTPGLTEDNLPEINQNLVFRKDAPFIVVFVMRYFEANDLLEKENKGLQLLTQHFNDVISR